MIVTPYQDAAILPLPEFRMKVAAIPRYVLANKNSWRSYFSQRKSYILGGHYFEYYEHDDVETRRDLTQILIFLAVQRNPGKRMQYSFHLPDGSVSCGIPLHLAAPDETAPGTIRLDLMWAERSPFRTATFSIKFPEEYVRNQCPDGSDFPSEISGRNIDWTFPPQGMHEFLWGPRLNNHLVCVYNFYLTWYFPQLADQILNSPRLVSYMDFLRFPQRDVLSELVARMMVQWKFCIG